MAVSRAITEPIEAVYKASKTLFWARLELWQVECRILLRASSLQDEPGLLECSGLQIFYLEKIKKEII